MVERDPVLIPGLTAGEWQGRARVSFVVGAATLLVVLGALAFGWRPHPVVLILPGVLVVAGFVGWLVFGEIALRVMRREREAGYSTTLDLIEVDLRDPHTGALVRAAGERPYLAPAVPFVSRMMRVPRGSLLDRMGARDDEADPRDDAGDSRDGR